MKIALVGPEKEENLSLRYLASSLASAGHEAILAPFDEPGDAEAALEACAGTDIIGLSMCFQPRAAEFIDLAEEARVRYPGALIVAGGHFASCAASELLANCQAIDVVVIHEGERTLVEVAAWRAAGSSRDGLGSIKGLAYREGGDMHFTESRPIVRDLDELPRPDRSGPVRLVAGVPAAYLFGSRGCVNDCDYCCIRSLHQLAPGPRFRQRSPERIADEMAELYFGRGIRLFTFHDDNFLVPSEEANLRRLDAFAEAFEKRGLRHIGIYMKCRPGDLSPAAAARLADLGLVRIFLGIESASARGYASLGRKQTPEDAERAFGILDGLGISVQYSMLTFHPDANAETLRSDLAFMRRHANHPFNFGRAELNAGTAIEERMLQAGRTTGSYLGRGYRMADPDTQAAWRSYRTLFLDRCSHERSLLNSAISLDHLSAVMRRFYDGPETTALSHEIETWRRRATNATLDLWEAVLDGEVASPAAEAAQRREFMAEHDILLRRLNALTLGMVGLEERDGRLRSSKDAGARRRLARHVAAAALAVGAAGAFPAYGLNEMEQRILDQDTDADGLFDDMEFAFGTNYREVDSDGNGIPDAKEDHDADGIDNLREQADFEELTLAARNLDLAEMRRLIERGTILDAVDPASEHTPLTEAAEAGRVEVARLLLESGADPEFRAWSGGSPLSYSAAAPEPESVHLLIEAGAQPYPHHLYHAASRGYVETVRILLEAGLDPNEMTLGSSRTALASAAASGHVDTVRLLLEAGADPTLRGEYGDPPLEYAKKEGHEEVIRILEEALGP
jgi:anaerobic magnesium-protoporphyrin IX monomethyl ester cyclase